MYHELQSDVVQQQAQDSLVLYSSDIAGSFCFH